MPVSFINRHYRAAIILSLSLSALSACAGNNRDGAQYYSESAAMHGGVYQMNSPAAAVIAAPPGSGKMKNLPSPQAIAQAADLAAQRHYKYFLLIGEKRNKWAGLPSFGLVMGRDPYGFRDGGRDYWDDDTGFDIGAEAPTFSFSGREDQGSGIRLAHWAVFMLNERSPQAVNALPIDKSRLRSIVSIYDAGNPDAPPQRIRLK